VTVDKIEPRAALLQSVIDAITRDGLGSRSLRDLAQHAGTSHRMLIHHFGSRDGLLVAIVTEVEARQRELLQTLPNEDTLANTWKRLADPSLWPFERLFFECYARGTQGEEPFDRLVPALVEDWLAVFPRGRGRDQARLGLAVIRGLLLDLVATEDRKGVDRAMNQFLELLHDAAKPVSVTPWKTS
jgi:AcrR family transcriptional regulator